MARQYVPIFFDWLEVTQDLTQEQKGNLIDASILYASGGDYESVLTGVERIAFRFIKGQIDRNAEISDARSKAGSNKGKQQETNNNKVEQTQSKVPKEKEKEKDKENKKEEKRFTPPTQEEVAEYCRERNNGIDAEYFVSYYKARDWVLSNGRKMKDWRSAIITWEKRDKTVKPIKTVVAQQYEQRNYSNEQEEAMRRMIGGAL